MRQECEIEAKIAELRRLEKKSSTSAFFGGLEHTVLVAKIAMLEWVLEEQTQ